MLNIEDKMIELLKEGVTFTKLKSKTGVCSSELVKKMNSLKNKGYIINKQFNEKVVKFVIGNNIIDTLNDNVKINVDNKFTFLVLSDTHIGNVYENMSLVNNLYKYAEEHNIKYVLHLGDMVEGSSLKENNDARIKRNTLQEQVDYLTRYYPKYDSINTLYILGNHDNRWRNEGIDISKIIDNRRYDMHCLGYKNSKITIGGRNILLHHPFTIERDEKYDEEIKRLYSESYFDLILRGHTHHNGIYINRANSIVVHVPACYNSPTRKYTGAYAVTLKNYELELTQLIIDSNVDEISHIKFPFFDNANDNYHYESNKKLEKLKKQ